MAVPAGVTLVTLNIDPPVGVSPAGLRIRIDPTWPDVSWSANGQALGTMLESPRRGVVSVKVPAVDQNGFVNSDGQVMKGWQYVLTVEGVIAGASIRTVRVISPKVAGGTLTFGVAIGEGGSASLPSYLDKAALDGSYVPVPGSAGTAGQVLSKTSNGTAWVAPGSGGSGSASNAVFDVESYGAVADNSTDCTAAIQAAMDAATAAGGGKILFPSRGIYRINGPQRTGTSAQSYAYSGQLLFPARTMTADSRIVLTFEGPLMAPQVAWQVGSEPAHTSGAILLSNATAGYVFDGIAGSASLSPITNVFGVFNNLTIRTPNNPQCGGLNGVTLAGMSVHGCSIDVNAPGNAITVPTGTRYGLRLPANGNAAFVHVTDTQITGYPVGLSHGEHAQLNNVAVQMTGVGIRAQSSYTHGAQYDRVLLQECIIGIQARGGTDEGGTIRGFVDFEDHPGTVWQSKCFIDDPDNELYGHLEIYSTTPLFKGYPVRGCHKLNLSDALLGAVGWMQSYPLDTFKRTVDVPDMIGTADKSTHPWVPISPWTTDNSTADADGYGKLKSQTENGLGIAIVNWFSRSNQDSRTVLGRFTMRASGGEIGIILNRISTNGNFLYVSLHNDGRVKIGKTIAYQDSSLAQSAAGLVAGGQTYKLAASFFHPIGTLPVVKAYLDGVEVASYTLTASETLLLTEQDDTNIERGDGVRTWSDTQSYCSMFKVIPSVT